MRLTRSRALIRWSWILAVFSVGLALGACQGDEGPGSTPAPSAVREMPPVLFRSVVWTTAVDPATGQPADRIEVFPRDTKRIIAAVEVMNLPAGGALTATWTMNGRPVEGLDSTIRVDRAQPSGWAEFHLDWAGPTMWPVGTLTILITSSTGETVESSVRIG